MAPYLSGEQIEDSLTETQNLRLSPRVQESKAQQLAQQSSIKEIAKESLKEEQRASIKSR